MAIKRFESHKYCLTIPDITTKNITKNDVSAFSIIFPFFEE